MGPSSLFGSHINRMCRIIAIAIFAVVVANASTSEEDFMLPEIESPEEFDESFDQKTKSAESLEKATAKEKAAKASHSSSEAAAKKASAGHAASTKSEAEAKSNFKKSSESETAQKKKCAAALAAKNNAHAAQNKANQAMDESTAHEKVTKEAANASEKRAKGAAMAKQHAEKDNKAEISNKEKAKKELDQKERKQKEIQQKSAEKASKEKDFKVKNTCTVTAYEHSNYGGKVTQTVKYCGGGSQNVRFATKSWARRRGYAASSFKLSSGCKQVQLWDEDACKKDYRDNVNIQSSVSSVKYDLNDDICGVTVWANRNGWCRL